MCRAEAAICWFLKYLWFGIHLSLYSETYSFKLFSIKVNHRIPIPSIALAVSGSPRYEPAYFDFVSLGASTARKDSFTDGIWGDLAQLFGDAILIYGVLPETPIFKVSTSRMTDPSICPVDRSRSQFVVLSIALCGRVVEAPISATRKTQVRVAQKAIVPSIADIVTERVTRCNRRHVIRVRTLVLFRSFCNSEVLLII